MPDRRALVANPHRLWQGVARFVTTRYYHKSAIIGPNVVELPSDVDGRFGVHAPVHHLVEFTDAGRVGIACVQHLPTRAFDVAQGRVLSYPVAGSYHPIQALDDRWMRQHFAERRIVRRR